jgi:hypothetical protein
MSIDGAERRQLVEARSALLDALIALADHGDSVVVVGAQAVYLHTGRAEVALAEATKDSDLAVDARTLDEDPLVEAAMINARFTHHPSGQPGSWLSPRGIPVDLMVPEAMAGSGRRSANVPPHDRMAMRRAAGLEAAVIDNQEMIISDIALGNSRSVIARVAGPSALIVAKMHKIGERQSNPTRLIDKDAHDVYRILVAIDTAQLSATFRVLLDDPLSGDVTAQAVAYMQDLFARGPEALASAMAGRAETGIGDPETVAATCAVLSADLLAAI